MVVDIFWVAVSQVFSRGGPIVASVILTNHFKPGDFAKYSFFQMTIAMAASYVAMGLGVAASKYFAEIDSSDENNGPPVGLVWVLSIFVSIAGTILFSIYSIISEGGVIEIPWYMYALGFAVVSGSIVPSGAILGLNEYKRSTIISFICSCVLMGGVFFSAWIDSPFLAMSSLIASSFVQMVGESFVVIKKIGWNILLNKNQYTFENIKKVTSVSGTMFFVTIFTASGSWLIGKNIMNNGGGAQEFSLYIIGMQWFSLGMFLPGVIGRVVFPRVVKVFSDKNNNKDRVRKLSTLSALTSVAVAIVVSVIVTALFPWIKSFYGQGYGLSINMLACFFLAAILVAPAGTLGNVIIASNKHKAWLFLIGMSFIAMMASNYVFISYGSISGAISHVVYGLFLLVGAVVYLYKRRNINE